MASKTSTIDSSTARRIMRLSNSASITMVSVKHDENGLVLTWELDS